MHVVWIPASVQFRFDYTPAAQLEGRTWVCMGARRTSSSIEGGLQNEALGLGSG